MQSPASIPLLPTHCLQTAKSCIVLSAGVRFCPVLIMPEHLAQVSQSAMGGSSNVAGNAFQNAGNGGSYVGGGAIYAADTVLQSTFVYNSTFANCVVESVSVGGNSNTGSPFYCCCFSFCTMIAAQLLLLLPYRHRVGGRSRRLVRWRRSHVPHWFVLSCPRTACCSHHVFVSLTVSTASSSIQDSTFSSCSVSHAQRRSSVDIRFSSPLPLRFLVRHLVA